MVDVRPSASTETTILLLPHQPGIEETAKEVLLKRSGVLGVAIHSFEGLASNDGVSNKRWYAAVTFNSLKISQDRLRELLQESSTQEAGGTQKVLAVNRGMVNLALQKDRKGGDDLTTSVAGSGGGSASSSSSADLKEEKATHFSMVDPDSGEEDSIQEKRTQNLGDDLDEWWGKDGDSDSEDEAGREQTTGGATYLEEDLGEKKKQQVNFFAPLVGVFGMDGAQQFGEARDWAVRPYGIKSDQVGRIDQSENKAWWKVW